MRAYEIFIAAAIVLPMTPAGASNPPAIAKDAPSIVAMPLDGTPPKGPRPSPVPRGNPGTWANTNDYPTLALAQQREGTTGFRLTVNGDGRVSSCTIIESSGHPDLDQATCVNVTRRAMFWPALDANGNPKEGTWSSRVRWQIPANRSIVSQSIVSESFPRPPRLLNREKLSIAAEDYPAKAKAEGRSGTSKLALAIDAKGMIKSCGIANSSGHADLDAKACELARAWTFEPALGPDGQPVNGRSTITMNWMLPGQKTGPRSPRAPLKLPGYWKWTGSVTNIVEVDATGKVVSCKTETSGDAGKPEQGGPPNIDFCQFAKTLVFEPYLDSEGKAEARKLILTSTVAHQPIGDAKTVPDIGEQP